MAGALLEVEFGEVEVFYLAIPVPHDFISLRVHLGGFRDVLAVPGIVTMFELVLTG